MTTAVKLLPLLLLAIASLSSAQDKFQCPFDGDKNCICQRNYQQPINEVFYADCSFVGDLLPFVQTGGIDTITNSLELNPINGSITIPASAFKAFKSIGSIDIKAQSKSAEPNQLTLDPLAFDGLTVIEHFGVDGFPVMFPLQNAFRKLNQNSIQSISVSNSKSCNIGKDEFGSTLKSLQRLHLVKNDIQSIDDTAFESLTALTTLELQGPSSLKAFPKALNSLTKLQSMDLTGNQLNSFPSSAFSVFPDLETLILTENDGQAALDAGAFKDLPTKLEQLTLDSTGLTRIPTDLIALLPSSVKQLNIQMNNISAVRVGDIPATIGLGVLELTANPITCIEPGAFKLAKSVKDLSLIGTNVSTFDVSLFDGMDTLDQVLLIMAGTKKVLVSNPDQVPSNLTELYLGYSSVNAVDSSLSSILDRQVFKILDLAGNTYICDESINWLAKYIICPSKFSIYSDDANCQNSKLSLEQYLKQSVPNPCL